MKIIESMKDLWDSLDHNEKDDLKMWGLISLIAVPVIILATGFLLPYAFPALAMSSFTIGALCAVGYLIAAFLKALVPVISIRMGAIPSVDAFAREAPASGLVSTQPTPVSKVDRGPVTTRIDRDEAIRSLYELRDKCGEIDWDKVREWQKSQATVVVDSKRSHSP